MGPLEVVVDERLRVYAGVEHPDHLSVGDGVGCRDPVESEHGRDQVGEDGVIAAPVAVALRQTGKKKQREMDAGGGVLVVA